MPFKIRRKLTLAFVGIILFIISVVGVIAWYNQKAIFNSLHRVEYAYTEREYFSDIRIAVEKAVMAANDYLITGDRKEREVFDRSASEAERLFREIPYEKVCKRCHPAAKGIVDRFYAIKGKELVEEMKYLKELSDSFTKIRSKGEEIFAIDRPVGSAAGARLMEEMDAIYHSETGRIIMSYRGAIRGRVSEAIAAAQGVRGRSWLIMLLAAVILASIGLIFSRLYARSFVLPIETMHEKADTIARGDFKARVDVKSHDEIGQLANAMNEMAAQLESFFSDFDRQLDERTAELRESEERYRVLGMTAPNAVICLKAPDTVIFWNRRATEIFGYSEEEVIGKPIHGLIVPERYREKAGEGMKNFFQTGTGPVVGKKTELSALRRDGSEFPIELSLSAMNIRGEWQATGIVRDITERKQAEEIIKKERDYSKRLVETANAIILTLDPEGRIVSFNRYMEEISGYKLDEVKGKDWFTTFLPECDYDRIRSLFKEAISGILTKGNVNPILTKDGREVVIEWYANTLKDLNGKITGLLAIGQDVTERIKTEEKLKQRIDDLEMFRKISIKRELRMEELQRKVDELERQLGVKSSELGEKR